MKKSLCALSILLLITELPGCFRNPSGDAEKEFRLLMDNQYSASGSTLTYETCGWPVTKKLKLKSLKVDLFPDSRQDGGRGYVDITTEGENFSCGGKLFFVYGYSYTGGHGYSGGTDLALNIITRESEVPGAISEYSGSSPIETGKTVSAELESGDRTLPDGSPADFYCIDLKGEKPGLKFTLIKGEMKELTWAVYQERKFLSQYGESGIKLKPGWVYIVITAKGNMGRYSFRLEELTPEEWSYLR